ncbi:molybdopterin molybdotransferase [Deinococcus metalli]|uniref:Molybdopterin molybdenumtransferase n=1 Tax=Deinococcus metalli TaxID=1141878 RepID=A0A7W8KIF2_9DEIO|nr:molybdopterin molybdotransferase MoeA [Deinococcus metalli]MBB5378762.1 molybdopterin molybdotransferase [Deinococcus metalli]GHF60166.1 molybdopterin molybdenumtransferase MoeA [Deinococcus metalli]
MTARPSTLVHATLPEALAALQHLLPARRAEEVPLTGGLGRVLASPLSARADHPSATESAMDGVACRAADAAQVPVTLKLVGESRAGAPFVGTLGPGEAVRISTGAVMPAGADAVCRREDLRLDGEIVTLLAPARPSDVRAQGSDFQAGDPVLEAGTRLTPARLALAAAMGHAALPVVAALRVGVLSGGDELVEPGGFLRAGQTYNANPYGLWAALREDGHDPVLLPAAADTPGALEARLNAAGDLDLLISSGGVGAGGHDQVRRLLERGNVLFSGLGIRPGAPTMAGRWQGRPIIALPGNPVAALVVYEVLVRPLLTGKEPRTISLQAGTPFRDAPGRTAYWRALVRGNAAFDQKEQGSGMLRSLAQSDALVVIPAGGGVAAGGQVEVIMLS